jgi:hypothetical protein
MLFSAMAEPTETELTPQARNNLRDLLTGLQKYVDESTPQGALLKERDHWVRMWDDVMQEVLKNMESIRDEQRALRNSLSDAARTGTSDTERIIQAINAATEQIIGAIERRAAIRRKRAWWDFR